MLDPAVLGPEGRQQRSRPPLLRTMLGDKLRRARLEQRRTLADVARAANISLQYLSEVERGLKEASSEVLAAICEALGVELSDLLVAVGRGLVSDRVRRAQVIRLETARSHISSRLPGPGDVMCRLAA